MAGELSCDRVGFGYGPGTTALAVPKLRIGAGERVAVLVRPGLGRPP